MGQIDYYERLYAHKPGIKPITVIQPPEVNNKPLPFKPEINDITLAQYDLRTTDVITAHKLKDYRRKQFNFVLLPRVSTMFDKLLEGSPYWNELLKNEGTYS